ncbi:CPXCG motif-containing cysteine-rich protein [Ferrimonas aestuarii]|uniref:CPXCG motif-containing cysteine-rich protein n=1 Tax=Ferrimonas aestuarii TaxID=2569539 RepID=A0A4U1BRG1_9GAMM|nr:CPXCG motif-containing cysteine-rich protein [Ferrimonas aestuarii]TKB57434.1 CPXCG motif-containing cysteine-rich protein [Ferrimonas aestuarii]
MRGDAFYQTVLCPHCGQATSVSIDASGGDQEYFEDCQSCCNPIHLQLHIDQQRQSLQLRVDSDDEQLY